MRSAVLAALALSCAAAPPPASPPPRPLPSHAQLEPLVRELAAETANLRGLAFTREVPFRVETVAQVTAHQRGDANAQTQHKTANDDPDLLETRVGVALGQLPEGLNLTEARSRFVGAEAQGYYDPDEGVLVLTETEARGLLSPGPDGLEARATIVHELTHALQHQHFPGRVLGGAVQPPDASDAARARLALLEGDATLVAMEWAARRRGQRLLGTPALMPRVRRWAEGAQVLTEVDVPAYLVASAEVPYELGALGVAMMHSLGGWARVNAALSDASLRTASVLHPEREGVTFVDVEAPRDAALEGAGFRRTEERTMGEVELLLLLERNMHRERAAALASSWRGDRFSLYEGNGRLAARWTLALATSEDATAIAQRLEPIAARWRSEGCPALLGGTRSQCPVTLRAEGTQLRLQRGQ